MTRHVIFKPTPNRFLLNTIPTAQLSPLILSKPYMEGNSEYVNTNCIISMAFTTGVRPITCTKKEVQISMW